MGTEFVDLPFEIHEKILDHLFGEKSPVYQYPKKHSALRHARRRSLSNLALICRLWTLLVQHRIYRHSEFLPSHECCQLSNNNELRSRVAEWT